VTRPREPRLSRGAPGFDYFVEKSPSTLALLLGLFYAILMALGVVREKELGPVTNLYVMLVTRFEFLIGKQLPYVAVGLINFVVLLLMALFVFQVPLKGEPMSLFLGVLLYVTSMTAYGMLISAFTSTQIAALFGASILTVIPVTQFSGMLTPVASLAGGARIIGSAFPMTYFVPISVGAFTKGLGFADLRVDLAISACSCPFLLSRTFSCCANRTVRKPTGECGCSAISIGLA
jgi:ribosome-dependent ATPase